MTPKERLHIWREIRYQKMLKTIGLTASVIGRRILENQGHEVDFKINGFTLDQVIQMDALNLKEQLNLAIQDQRFEHAAILRDKIKEIGA